VVVATLGLRKGWRVIRLITGWSLCWQTLGHEPTVAEFVEWSDLSRATVYRDLELFRLVFTHDDPSVLVGRARAQLVRARGEAATAAVVIGLPV